MASSRQKNIIIHRPIVYGNVASPLTPEERSACAYPDHTHKWTAAVRSAASIPGSDIVGGADDISYYIRKVVFKLHDTYPNPTRTCDRPPYEVTETGWGEFEIKIAIHLIPDANEKPITLFHHIKLHPWPGPGDPEIPPIAVAMAHGPVHSWQYDEIVFYEPTAALLSILVNHPPTPLPKEKKKPVPYHITNPKSLEESKGGTPEFSQAMEKEEYERLEAAKKGLMEEQEQLKQLFQEKEKELARLQKQLLM